jgi:two-component system chemotaxis sensor kinase CheA
MRDDDRTKQEFISEAEELLDELGRDLRTFESAGGNVRPEVVNKIFRGVHSLKGLAGMLGFTAISELSHSLEDLLDRLRLGKIGIDGALTDLLFDSIEGLGKQVAAVSIGGEYEFDAAPLIGRIADAANRKADAGGQDILRTIHLDEQTLRSLTEYEEHRLRDNVKRGRTILAVSVAFDFATFDRDLRQLTETLTESGEVVSTLPSMDATRSDAIAFRLLYGTDLSADAVAKLVPEGTSVTDLRVSATPATREAAPKSEAAPVPEAVPAVEKEKDRDDGEGSLRSLSQTVRVDIGKLDRVMNIVGELILEKANLEGLARRFEAELGSRRGEIRKTVRNFDRKLDDLQKSIIDVRMVPVGQIYAKLARAVRKIARESGKEIALDLRGEETELDKAMVEELTDPLLHIIRNAIDHGIEAPSERVAVGKPAEGRIVVSAYQRGNAVVIEVRDDGHGIDTQKILQVARKRGLIGVDENVPAERAYEIIFLPGFSSAEKVSEISGRGVGLDVVRRNLGHLKGSVRVGSVLGEGTTFEVELPITLAIIQALVVRCAGQVYAIPLTSVSESLRIRRAEIQTVETREVFYLRDFTLPLVRLDRIFNLPRSEEGEKLFVVVARVGEKSVGIVVDSLVRQREIVIKPIGDRLKNLPGIAGATELGENELVLVADVASLIEKYAMTGRGTLRKTA